ncbi:MULTISPECIES: hypothetical protein [unclassified Xanthomonas]|uniref:hypothetical protein n=1 Tax=unclassified Xanthomonas TaxID=2643310 RepID=UPI002A80ED8F|nr:MULTISPECIES: hypothetical protein [unclassified Xanthomonas]MDY4296845.1 hypothetical protein [Xanthomonas sp. LF02-5]MDY4358396.1 hypothetical protein [Xanthomonas sp. LF04-12]
MTSLTGGSAGLRNDVFVDMNRGQQRAEEQLAYAGESESTAFAKGKDVLRNDERWVIHMEAGVRFVPSKAPNVMPISELRQILEETIAAGNVTFHPDPANKDEVVTLDFVHMYPVPAYPTHMVLLFTYTNKSGADPGFRNLDTGSSRTAPKKKGEGNATSAHLVISLKDKHRKGHSYWPAILEDVGGLGKTKMQAALNHFIASRRNFSFKDEEGNVVAASARFYLDGLDDQKLEKDMEKGRISYFVAIKEKKDKPSFDELTGLRVASQITKLKPSKEFDGPVKGWLNKIAEACRGQGYDKVRVHYVRQDGKNRSLTFGTHREDAEDFLIKQVDRIVLQNIDLAQTHPAPCVDLIKAMTALMK